MKKRLTTKIRKTTASILVAITILASGGYKVITNIFGTNKQDNTTLNFDKTTEQNDSTLEENIDNKTNNQTFFEQINETENYQYKYTPQYVKKENQTFKIETTEAISQTEHINTLIRKRRKLYREKLNIKSE